ncbi:hypothetical protein Krac_3192 [Ktedonobacter racemifer DSM 44963]|uniref:Uncharacterized protein n=1 Tax=Ktedonobacter racemifer DSM 44963 TaxID=485913 RepID=D6U0P3_KTERA|nr:hypothetical protein Krac_3192 [Ktedonobacter racemifer DSM 44963]
MCWHLIEWTCLALIGLCRDVNRGGTANLSSFVPSWGGLFFMHFFPIVSLESYLNIRIAHGWL